jgi:hypothetical protein
MQHSAPASQDSSRFPKPGLQPTPHAEPRTTNTTEDFEYQQPCSALLAWFHMTSSQHSDCGTKAMLSCTIYATTPTQEHPGCFNYTKYLVVTASLPPHALIMARPDQVMRTQNAHKQNPRKR